MVHMGISTVERLRFKRRTSHMRHLTHKVLKFIFTCKHFIPWSSTSVWINSRTYIIWVDLNSYSVRYMKRSTFEQGLINVIKNRMSSSFSIQYITRLLKLMCTFIEAIFSISEIFFLVGFKVINPFTPIFGHPKSKQDKFYFVKCWKPDSTLWKHCMIKS